jgi:SAM-dependent methyltransferase
MTTAGRALTSDELREEVIRLGPWHIDIEITPEVSSAAFLDAPPGTYPEDASRITFHNPHDGFLRRIHRAFPGGLEGRSVLDCACNCGAYLFYAKEAGAGRCFGFDIREHWIRQARFLAEHREQPSDDMRFEVVDLYDLPSRAPGRFDLTLFLGIFYHLPDPVTGLKMAADLTNEVLILNTATKAGLADGSLIPEQESLTRSMSGAYGLCWYPTGPEVLIPILRWLGFAEFRCSIWRHAPRQRADLDRLELIAARTPGFFASWDAATPPGPDRLRELVEAHTRPGATVLVIGDFEQLAEVNGRETIPFSASADDAVAALELRRAAGAQFVLVLGEALSELSAHAALAERLEQGRRVVDREECRLYVLGETQQANPHGR